MDAGVSAGASACDGASFSVDAAVVACDAGVDADVLVVLRGALPGLGGLVVAPLHRSGTRFKYRGVPWPLRGVRRQRLVDRYQRPVLVLLQL
eukprot:2401923-Pyramimonas_sp.AAC.1